MWIFNSISFFRFHFFYNGFIFSGARLLYSTFNATFLYSTSNKFALCFNNPFYAFAKNLSCIYRWQASYIWKLVAVGLCVMFSRSCANFCCSAKFSSTCFLDSSPDCLIKYFLRWFLKLCQICNGLHLVSFRFKASVSIISFISKLYSGIM